MRRNIEQPEIVRLYTVLAAEALDPAHPAHDYFADRLRQGTAALAAVLGRFPHLQQTALEIYCHMYGLQLNWLRDPRIDMWRQRTDYADNLFARVNPTLAAPLPQAGP